MADRRTHKVVGGASGAIAAAYVAQNSEPIHVLMEALGGAIGGVLGSLLPDEFEPAIHSWHRSFAHSLSGAAAGVATLPALIDRWQEHCRARAVSHDRLCEQASDEASRLWHALCAVAWRILSGLIIGIAVGYLSHLASDTMTPRGLPLLM